MTTIGTLIVGAVLSLGTLFGVNSLLGNTANVGGGTGTINQLQQFVATTSPVSAITQAVFGKSFRLSGQSTGCAQFDSNGVLTSTGSSCGGISQWTTSGSDIYYNTGNVGIGSTTPVSQLTVQKTLTSETDYPALALSRNDNTLNAGDSIGDIDFWANDASTDGPGIGSRIRGVAEGAAGRSYGVSLWTRSGDLGTPISEKMRIASDGKVGVGTSSPLAKLDIYDASASSVIVLSSGYNTGADSNKNWGLFQSGLNYGDFAIKESNVVGGNPISAGTTRLLIQKVTGNVGIGTTNPESKLQIGAPSTGENIGSVPVMRILGSALGTTPQTMLRLNRILNQNSFYSGGADFNIKSYGVSGTPFLPKTQLDIALKSTAGQTETADVIVMSLRDNGNVGIGTTTPWTRLAVTGSTTIAGGPLIVLGSANTPISADTDWYRQFGIFRKDINDYSFMTLENRNGGSNASVDFLFNNDRTTALSYYWDLGFNSSAFNNPAFGLLNVPNAAYEYVTDGPRISATATTSSAGYFDFITGGFSSSRLRITSTGNIGIGTTSPRAKLNVYSGGSGVGTANTAGDDLVVENSNDGGISILTPNANSSFLMFGSPADSFGAGAYWNSNNDLFTILTANTGADISFQTGDQLEAMRIFDSGNIAIGTSTPASGSAVRLTSVSSQGGGIQLADTDGGGAVLTGLGGDAVLYTYTGLVGSEAYSERLRVLGTSGFVGIGTTTPQSTLSVGSVNDATNSYAQIDSVNGAPTAGDCDTDLERGRMIIDYSNNRFYICNGATRGWDYSALTD